MEPPQVITLEQIRQRAYEMWERNHRPDRFEIELWLTAERELKAERKKSFVVGSADQISTPPAAPKVEGQKIRHSLREPGRLKG